MNSQAWRTYALLLHLLFTYKLVTWLLDLFGNPWGYVTAIFAVGLCLLGLIIPVTAEEDLVDQTSAPSVAQPGRHRA